MEIHSSRMELEFLKLPSVISPQRISLQRPVIILGPTHGSPLMLGVGESQRRFRIPVPPLQLTLHAHGPHSDQPPSTGGPSISFKEEI